MPGILEEWPDADCKFVVEVYFDWVYATYTQLLADANGNALKETFEFTCTAALDSDGVYRMTITRAELEAMDPTWLGTDWTDDDTVDIPWRMLIYFDNGTRSEPTEIRLKHVASGGVFGYRDSSI